MFTKLIVVPYWEEIWERGNKLDRRADGILHKNGRKLFFEFDTGSMGYGRVHDRFQKSYAGQGVKLFVVCLNKRRLEQVKQISYCVRDCARFALPSEIAADPYGEIWQDVTGKRFQIFGQC